MDESVGRAMKSKGALISGQSQSAGSVRKNASFFRDHLTSYGTNVRELDTYRRIREYTSEAVKHCHTLLDIGNGGVFDYDTAIVNSIVAIDLFFDELSPGYRKPPNVTFKAGSALDLPAHDASFDCVLMVMLLHHLIGNTVQESLNNTRRALEQAWRVLQPGGRLVIVESCVPKWFYTVERIVFRPATAVINRLFSHPATLQYPPGLLEGMLADLGPDRCDVAVIPKGRWVLQYGVRWPSFLTPVRVVRFVCYKR
jgi:ubiquinone/menaquinone biosynthesis C-methylase UbiE